MPKVMERHAEAKRFARIWVPPALILALAILGQLAFRVPYHMALWIGAIVGFGVMMLRCKREQHAEAKARLRRLKKTARVRARQQSAPRGPFFTLLRRRRYASTESKEE